ncbi:hypothetical protein B0H34DRAFT_713619, partial [Crassisporium funariophilum]
MIEIDACFAFPRVVMVVAYLLTYVDLRVVRRKLYLAFLDQFDFDLDLEFDFLKLVYFCSALVVVRYFRITSTSNGSLLEQNRFQYNKGQFRISPSAKLICLIGFTDDRIHLWNATILRSELRVCYGPN